MDSKGEDEDIDFESEVNERHIFREGETKCFF